MVPIRQISQVIINSNQSKLTTPLINALCDNGTGLIVCDGKHNPSCEIVNLGKNTFSAGRIIDQSRWTQESKDYVWQNIVKLKIHNQMVLLKKLNITIPSQLHEYETTVLPGDSTNREAIAAGLYFKSLFGKWFRRHSYDDSNIALNYGYTILLSSFNRILTTYGFHTALGINHCSRTNRYNLSCDLMEPFRTIVDEIVYENTERDLDWEYKKLFIEMLEMPTDYKGKQYNTLSDAIERYSLNVMRTISELNNFDFGENDVAV